MKRRAGQEPKLDVTLSIRPNGLNLPTMDPNCMAVQAYLKFINVKAARVVTQARTEQPFIEFVDPGDKKKKVIYGAKDIIDYIRSQQPPSKYDLDAGLTAKQRSRHSAVMALLQENLIPALLYYWWLYGDNYSHDVRPAINSHVAFLYKLITPYTIRSRIKRQITAKFGKNVSKVDIFSMVVSGFETLAAMLNSRPFFLYADKPSSLDAYVFGCLSCFYYPKLKDFSLSSLLKKHPTLCMYCTEMTRKYFSDCTDSLKLPALEDTNVTLELLKEEQLTQRYENQKTWLFLGISTLAISSTILLKIAIQQAIISSVGEGEIEIEDDE